MSADTPSHPGSAAPWARMLRSFRNPPVGGRRLLTAATALFMLLGAVFAPAASAHDILVSSDPRDGQTIAPTHHAFVLTFSDKLQPFGAELVFEDAHGKQTSVKAEITKDQVRGNYGGDLPVGQGSLKWRAVSSDGHPIEGVIAFTVADPKNPGTAASAPASADQKAQPAEKNIQTSKINLPLLILGLLAVLTGALGTIVGYRLRKNGR